MFGMVYWTGQESDGRAIQIGLKGALQAVPLPFSAQMPCVDIASRLKDLQARITQIVLL